MFALGLPPDTADEHGNSVLHVGCQNGNKRMVKAALRWGANINAQNVGVCVCVCVCVLI
jgi:hypothetical protein